MRSRVTVRVIEDGAPRSAIQRREMRMPLPTHEERYRRVLVLGTTGAGKTTVMRQLLGTDPQREKFPATSPNKTTVAPTEVISRPMGDYGAIVTFHSREDTLAALEENILFAAAVALEGGSDVDVAERLLDHRDLAFRFSYTLGRFKDVAIERRRPLTPEDLERQSLTQTWVNQIRSVVDTHAQAVAVVDSPDAPELRTDAAFDHWAMQLRDQMLEQIRLRFAQIPDGQWEVDASGWPTSWTWSSPDRADFLHRLRTFTGNEVKRFGELLTPLVNGVRVQGPFQPKWAEDESRLVLLDTEGLGHVHRTATAIPNHVVQWMRDADAILVVDNAQQPVQASPAKALETIAVTGNTDKLFYLFTHMDQIRGDNLEDDILVRQGHIRQSLDQVLGSLKSRLGDLTGEALKGRCDSHTDFVGNLHEVLDPDVDEHQDTLEELRRLTLQLNSVPRRQYSGKFTPYFDGRVLDELVQRAREDVLNEWVAMVGNEYRGGDRHWATVKALTRRLGPLQSGYLEEGWRQMYPAASLREALEAGLRGMTEDPIRWDGGPLDAEKLEVLDEISQGLTRQLVDLTNKRVLLDQIGHWEGSYLHAGTGSTRLRARDILEILVRATQQPTPLVEELRQLLTGLRDQEGRPLLQLV